MPTPAALRELTGPEARAERRARRAAESAPWRGPTRRYDILKEGTIAALVALVLTVGLAVVLSSPDVPPVTVRSWVQVAPGRLPRHRGHRTGRDQHERHPRAAVQQQRQPRSKSSSPRANWAGVRQPIDTAQTFVLQPLAVAAANDPRLNAALAAYNAAPAAQQDKWTANYASAVTRSTS